MAHTPGPFVAEPLGVAEPFEYAVATASGDILAYVRREADADFFAAAPEMKQALSDLLYACQQGHPGPMMDRASALLAQLDGPARA